MWEKDRVLFERDARCARNCAIQLCATQRANGKFYQQACGKLDYWSAG